MKDLHGVLKTTHEHLQFLETEIRKGIHDVAPGYFDEVIKNLSKDSNLLVQGIHKMREKAVQVDSDLNYQLLATIDRIRHAQSFWMALGASQSELFKIFKKIETAIKEWTPRVEKTEQHPM